MSADTRAATSINSRPAFFGSVLTITVAISASLLFAVQPLVGRLLLPTFGGAAQVWLVCLTFFQCALLLGYLYAYLSVRWLGSRLQAMTHLLLLATSFLLLPLSVRGSPSVGEWGPTSRLLMTLVISVGLPYVALSATTTLVQSWYVRLTRSTYPYWLFAVSNAGSVLGLLAYPFFVEPLATLQAQKALWSFGYLAFALSCGGIALTLYRHWPTWHEPDSTDGSVSSSLGASTLVMCLVLPACSSALLLGLSQYLTQNIAPVPLLWVPVLALYLVSFILAYSTQEFADRVTWLLAAAPALMVISALTLVPVLPVLWRMIAMLVGFFLVCLACHAELARLRPPPSSLATYYLAVSAGGAMGGAIVSLVAPVVFDWHYEFPLALALTAVVLGGLAWRRSAESLAQQSFRALRIVSPLAAGLTLALLGVLIRLTSEDTRRVGRDFYGVLMTVDQPAQKTVPAQRRLVHGTIVHGAQLLAANTQTPTTYFTHESGAGIVLSSWPAEHPRHVGIIGLGVGTLAAYGRPGDVFRFYEISPLVLEFAKAEFSFLAGSQARVETVLGDARLVLEREKPQQFDVLVVDAFSSDSIPSHLLTQEALQLYFRHLKAAGVLAVHISNRYLDLEPVVATGARTAGRSILIIQSPSREERAQTEAIWALIGSDQALQGLARFAGVRTATRRQIRPWTDDYTSVLSVIR